MMLYVCKHGVISFDCDDCYSDARAKSEECVFETYYPPSARCKSHVGGKIDDDGDCYRCLKQIASGRK